MNLQSLPAHINTLVNTLKQTPTAADTQEHANMHVNIMPCPPDTHMLSPNTLAKVLYTQ